MKLSMALMIILTKCVQSEIYPEIWTRENVFAHILILAIISASKFYIAFSSSSKLTGNVVLIWLHAVPIRLKSLLTLLITICSWMVLAFTTSIVKSYFCTLAPVSQVVLKISKKINIYAPCHHCQSQKHVREQKYFKKYLRKKYF